MRSFLVCCIVTLVLRDGILSQVFDDKTTLFPLPPTSFSCQGRSPGYYADLETGCRTYHVCDGNSHFTYICPERTLFQQKSRICDHAYLVRCENSFTFEDDVYPEDEDEILLRLVESEDEADTEDTFRTTTQTGEFTTEILKPIKIQTTTTTEKSTAEPMTVAIQQSHPVSDKINITSVNYSSQTNRILKFVIKDARSLFYIPEISNNSVTVQAEREFVLPVDKKNLLRFRYGQRARHAFSACPSYCDPKFFLPGTCHPCIMIK